ncbi:MAG: hypothetical protein JJU33_12850 [Phycisphaerales bacterium]|nr:hypothetical protein [Phycisphaerales bacterium]
MSDASGKRDPAARSETQSLLGLLGSRITDADLDPVAEAQYGPREPVKAQLVRGLRGDVSDRSLSFATCEAMWLFMSGGRSDRRGLLLLCYVMLVEDTLVSPKDSMSSMMHSFLPIAMKDVFGSGDAIVAAFGDWLGSCEARLRESQDITDSMALRSFFRLGVLFVCMQRSTAAARRFVERATHERALLDLFFASAGDEPTSTAFDLDLEMDDVRKSEWVGLWRNIAGDFAAVYREVQNQLDPSGGS